MKEAPIVDSLKGRKALVTKRREREDLPTPVGPRRTTFTSLELEMVTGRVG